MKISFRKITPILASAVLLGSTIGFAGVAADLAAYPSPFVAKGVADVSIVYGIDGMAKDMEAAGLFTSDLASELASQTVISGDSAVGVTGEGIALSTHESLYYGDSINRRRKTLAKEQLPTLLGDGTFTDGQGTDYKYTQSITLGDSLISFGKSSESIDPVLMIDIGSRAQDPVYSYKLSLSKSIAVNDSSYVQGKEIAILGNKYTIGSGSTNTTLYLYGAGVQITLSEGEEKTVTVGGVEHTISLDLVTSNSEVRLTIDGVAQSSVANGGTVKKGDMEIYVRDVAYTGKTGQMSFADLNIGSTKLKLQDGQTVKTGADEDTVLGTGVKITGEAGNKISEVEVNQSAKESTGDYIGINGAFNDRVFGAIKVELSSVTPALDAANRDIIEVYASDVDASVKFTSALSGGEEYELVYAHDNDGEADGDVVALLADGSNRSIIVQEEQSATRDPAQYIVVNAGDKGRILQVTSIDVSSANSKTVLTDVIDDTKFEFVTGTNGKASLVQDGQTYYINATATEVKLTWGAGSTYNMSGTQKTLFPRIKLKNGGWMAFLKETTLTNGTTYVLPGIEDLTTYEAGQAITISGIEAGQLRNKTFGNVIYSISGAMKVEAVLNSAGSVLCNFSAAYGPAILIVEEHKTGEANGDAICIPLQTEGTSPVKLAMGQPGFTGTSSGFHTMYSDNYKKEAVNKYGTHVLYDTTDLNRVTVAYPDTEMIFNIILGAMEAEAAVTTAAGVTKLGDILLTDTEAETSKPADNLIVVGGSAVNKVSAKLLGVDYPTYGMDDAWQTATGVTGAGQAIIKLFASPYSADKKAMLIAGWDADDTIAAAKTVIKGTGLSGVDSKVIKKTVDY